MATAKTIMMALTWAATAAMTAPVAGSSSPEQLVNESGVSGGLVVHVGCVDGSLTRSLRINQQYQVEGLSTDIEQVGKAREVIRSSAITDRYRSTTFVPRSCPTGPAW